MPSRNIGVLHPGKMGITIAASARSGGNNVYWVSEGRSKHTRDRALEAGLKDAGTLRRLSDTCSIIVSVCPPEFAEDVAGQVLECSFRGVYVDANAIAPQRSQEIDRRMLAGGAGFVDGGIIGPPALVRGTTWLCLSGPCAGQVAECFSGGPLETEVLGESIGRASALKMCFAAHTKGVTALLCAVLAAAERLGVLEDLKRQWTRHGTSFPEVEKSIAKAAPKAWRFIAEMHEIEATFAEAGVPPEFHRASAEIYRRLEGFKDAGDCRLDDILSALLNTAPSGHRGC